MLKKEWSPIRLKMRKIISKESRFAVLFVLTALIFACGSKKEEESTRTNEQVLEEVSVVKAVGKVVPETNWAIVSSPVAARIIEINVQEGDSVVKGQSLITLDQGTANLDVQEARARLRSLQTEHLSTRDELKKAQIYEDELRSIYETSRRLLAQNAETREKVERDLSSWKQQEQVVFGLRQRLKAHEASETEQRVLIEKSEAELANFRVESPADGILTDLTVKIGQSISISDELARVVDPSRTMIEAEVDELFANDVLVGQHVLLLTTGRTDTLGHGRIVSLNPVLSDKSILYETANEADDRRVRRVRIEADSTARLTVNAKVDVHIKIK